MPACPRPHPNTHRCKTPASPSRVGPVFLCSKVFSGVAVAWTRTIILAHFDSHGRLPTNCVWVNAKDVRRGTKTDTHPARQSSTLHAASNHALATSSVNCASNARTSFLVSHAHTLMIIMRIWCIRLPRARGVFPQGLG